MYVHLALYLLFILLIESYRDGGTVDRSVDRARLTCLWSWPLSSDGQELKLLSKALSPIPVGLLLVREGYKCVQWVKIKNTRDLPLAAAADPGSLIHLPRGCRERRSHLCLLNYLSCAGSLFILHKVWREAVVT